MAKSLTKLWLGGLKRLFAAHAKQTQESLKRTAARPLRGAAKPATKVRTKPAREAPHPGARESRVRPRAAAWASGNWTRSFHSAPAAPGRLVNHLSYGLYLPSGHAHEAMPLVVMLHGCTQSI